MNFLFDFLKNLAAPEREKLKILSFRGAMGKVWEQMNEQAAAGILDKDGILKSTGISVAHFDKITSELLGKSYQAIFGDDVIALLGFLSNHTVYVKLFYNELNRQVKIATQSLSVKEQADFYKRCFTFISTNLPIAYREPKPIEMLAKRYVGLFKGAEKKEAELYVRCRLLLEKMEVLFANATIKDNAPKIEKELDGLGRPLPIYGEDVVFAYYWTKIYFYHAIEEFAHGLEIARNALAGLKRFRSDQNEINALRIELKINEFLYYLSKFDEAYSNYSRVINSEISVRIPDRAYHTTKYIQVSLITGHIEEAVATLESRLAYMGERMEQLITPRDVVSCVKCYLFKGDYARAFRFLQLGFEKNPKGKYFQYEIELRNLQTAYFVLTGQQDIAIEMCPKHIKYLRNHGYTITNSSYPHFYVLTKAVFERKSGNKLSPKHQKMLDRYQMGSYAVYGRLLLKMLGT